MARSRRARPSRTLLSLVILCIIAGAVVQFRRTHKASAASKIVPVNAPVIFPQANPKADVAPFLAAVEPSAPVSMGPATRPADSLTPAIWKTPPAVVTPAVVTKAESAPTAVKAVATVAPSVVSSPTEVPSHLLSDAKSKADSGDLLAARKALNDALLSGNLSAGDADGVRKQIAQINQAVVFSSKHFPDDPFGGNYTVKPGEKLSAIATAHDTTWELLLRLNNMSDPRKLRAAQTLKVMKGPFHVVVTKSKFVMDVYLGSPGENGSMYVTSFPVGLGRDDSTPTGTWMVEPHHKLKHPTYYSPRGEGVIAAEDPKNPLGPFWIGLTGTDGHAVGRMSYGIHGTIEPDSIGKMASLGCIRMRNEDVAIVFELLVEGKSTVIVRD